MTMVNLFAIKDRHEIFESVHYLLRELHDYSFFEKLYFARYYFRHDARLLIQITGGH